MVILTSRVLFCVLLFVCLVVVVAENPSSTCIAKFPSGISVELTKTESYFFILLFISLEFIRRLSVRWLGRLLFFAKTDDDDGWSAHDVSSLCHDPLYILDGVVCHTQFERVNRWKSSSNNIIPTVHATVTKCSLFRTVGLLRSPNLSLVTLIPTFYERAPPVHFSYSDATQY